MEAIGHIGMNGWLFNHSMKDLHQNKEQNLEEI